VSALSHLSRRAVLALAFAATLCGAAGAASPPPKPLPVERLKIVTPKKTIPFQVEIAADDGSREYGLMNRPQMADDRGMIFDFHEPQPVAFWMRNTLIPLDMLFVAADGKVLNIARMAKPHDETPIPSAGPIRAVIEINGGLADKLGISPGDKVVDEVVFPPS
jgi:uncharacterized membrane protein (UPF0127 family)